MWNDVAGGGWSPRWLLLLLVLACAAGAVLLFGNPITPVISPWRPAATEGGGLTAEMVVVPDDNAVLDRFSAGATVLDSAANGRVRYIKRATADGGEVLAVVVALGEGVSIDTLTADGATLGSDATGDTIWVDGQKHLQHIPLMAMHPASARPGMDLLWAMAFGYHGERTADEGTVVRSGSIQRVNARRAAVCVESSGAATIGLFDGPALERCQSAFGAGPVLAINGKLTALDVAQETESALPFNPLGEDFVQLDYRKHTYATPMAQTAIGIGAGNDGRAVLVLAVGRTLSGRDLAAALVAMGCADVIAGDSGISTQATWRGQLVLGQEARPVPSGVAVYVAQ